MARVTAVAGSCRPSSRRTWPISVCDAPPPPLSTGTRALVKPVARSISNAATEISPLRSRSATSGWSARPTSRASATQSVVIVVVAGSASIAMGSRVSVMGSTVRTVVGEQ